MERITRHITHTLTLLTLVSVVLVTLFAGTTRSDAAANYTVNYQGKLLNGSNVAVANGTYNMRFWLLTSPTIATSSAVWTESLTGTNRVQVTNGLFSVMLGSTTPFTGVDFNQTLYLGVEIGGTSSPAWDGEMSPRKILGAVPAAFVAGTLDGLDSTQFVRTDATSTIEANTSDTLFTITQNGTGDVFRIFDGLDQVFTVADNGRVGIGTTTPLLDLVVDGDFGLVGSFRDNNGSFGNNGYILKSTGAGVEWAATSSLGFFDATYFDTSAELAAILGDETGTAGAAVFSQNPLLQGFRSNASSTIGDGTQIGGLTIFGGATTTGNTYMGGTLSLGSTTPGAMLTAVGTANTDLFRFASSTGSSLLRLDTRGALMFGTTTSFGFGPDIYINGGNPAISARQNGNTAIGNSALFSMAESAQGNTALGYLALYGFGSITGRWNVAIGGGALIQNSSGSSNTGLGVSAGGTNQTGNANTYLGYGADGTGIAFSTSTAIGAGAKVGCSNCLVLGGTGLNYANVGIGTTTPSRLLTVQGGDAWFGGNITGTGTLSIGSTTPSARLTIVGSGQNDIFRFASSTGSSLLSFDRFGVLSFGTTTEADILINVNNSASTLRQRSLGNVALGTYALDSNTTGSYNFAAGVHTLSANTTGSNNIGIGGNLSGFSALRGNITGSYNIALGQYALLNNTNADGNIGIGFAALQQVDGNLNRDSFNTAVGYQAGFTTMDGRGNTFLGAYADNTAAGISTSTAIGAGAKVGCSNCLVLGGTGANYANVGIGTTTPSRLLTVQGGDAWFGGNITGTGTLSIAGGATTSALYTTTLGLNSEYFTDLTGSGLTNSSNVLTCATSNSATFGCLTAADWSLFNDKVSSSSIDTSAELAAILGDETGTGLSVFNTNPLLQGFRSNASSTIGDGTATGGLTINGGATTTGNAYFAGNVGIGTNNPSVPLHITTAPSGASPYAQIWLEGDSGVANKGAAVTLTSKFLATTKSWYFGAGDGAGATNNNFRIVELGALNTDRFVIQANTGYIGIGTTTPSRLLTVNGDIFTPFNISAASSTITFASSTGITATNLYATNFTTTYGSSTGFTATNLYGTNALFTYASSTYASTTGLTVQGNTYLASLADGCLSTVSGLVTSSACGVGGGEASDWQLGGTGYLVPTSTVGIVVSASSTIGDGTQTGGLTIYGGATTTGNAYFGGNVTGNGTLSIAGGATTSALYTTTLGLNSEYFTDLTGSGLTNSSNVLTCATSNSATFGCLTAADWSLFNDKVSSSSIDTSAELAALVTDETGTGNLVFSNAPTFTGTTAFNALTVTNTSTLGFASSTALTVSGNSYFNFASSSYASTTGLTVQNNGYLMGSFGIGSTSPSARLSIRGTAGSQTPLIQTSSSTGSTTFAVLANGDVEVSGNFVNAGVEWTARTAASSANWTSVAYGNGTFVALANNGGIMVSTDGINWTLATSSTGITMYDVTYGNGLFVTVGVGAIVTSPDGINWTRRSSGSNTWKGVTYGNGLFVAVASNGGSKLSISRDGILWTDIVDPVGSISWIDAVYGNGRFVVIGDSGASYLTSTDGINWSEVTGVAGLSDIAYGNGVFVSVGNLASVLYILTSSDGTTWTTRTPAAGNSWSGVTYGNGLFVAVSTDGTNRVMTSPDGINWTSRRAQQSTWNAATYGNGTFVAVGNSGAVMTSGKSLTNAFALNNIYQGGMSVLGGAFNVGTTTATTSSFANNILNIASTTGTSVFTILQNGNVGIGSTSPSRLLTVNGDIFTPFNISAASSTITFASSTGITATNLYATNFTTTYGSSTGFTATNLYGTNALFTYASSTYASTTALTVQGNTYLASLADGCLNVTSGLVGSTACGVGGGEASDWQLGGTGYLVPSTTVGIVVSASSTIGDGTQTGGLTIFGGATTTGNTYMGGTLSLGSTTPSRLLTVQGGDAWFGGNLTATGTATFANLLVTGSSTIGGGTGATGLTILGNSTTTGNAYLTGTSTVLGKLNVGGSAAGTLSQLEVTTGNAFVGAQNMLRIRGNSTNPGHGTGISFAIDTAGSGAGLVGAKIVHVRTGGNSVGDLAFFTNSAGPGTGDGSSERMKILSTGQVAIGTGTPAAVFAVSASSSNAGSNLFAFSSSTGSSLLTLDARGVLNFGTSTFADIFVNGGPTSTATQMNSGNIAIGTQAFSYASTTDYAQFNIALGYRALYGSSSALMSGDNNIGIGYQALMNNATGSANVAVGSLALTNNTFGFQNVGVGYSALTSNTFGYQNAALGYGALLNNITGTNNTATGWGALASNVVGVENTAVGASALLSNTGSYNTAQGYRALFNNADGIANTAVGWQALLANTSGVGNTAMGYGALSANSTGIYNTAFGIVAGATNQTGNANVYLGRGADGTGSAFSTSTAIGANAKVGCSNCLVLGGTGADYANVGIGTTTPSRLLTVQGGDAWFGGNITGTGTATFANLLVTGSSTIGGGTQTTGLTIFGGATTTGNAYFAGLVSLGSTSPQTAKLAIQNTGVTGSTIAGIKEYFQFINSTESATYYGNDITIANAPTATSTLVGTMMRITDNTTLGNTVRGFEVQAERGTNTKGENTALSGFARTFGVRGLTTGDAGNTYLPAGVFAETEGTTQGNALRAYSGTITTEALVSFFQDTSNFIGTGLEMNFGNGEGSFAATTSAKFLDLQVAGTSKFTVAANGSTTIGDGSNIASLRVPYGGICVDNDGSCNASTTGRITSVTSAVGNSDLAEMYFSNQTLSAGDIVALDGGLSIKRATGETSNNIIGVVSTKPGLLMGQDDTSLRIGEVGYPVGLQGRVPIKLSTEQGPIKKGDRIALSSIPGVGMKATESDVVVGIALEDFDGTRAYSEGFLNQFGDDMVNERRITRTNIDPRTQDGCYYSGGEQNGKPCVPKTGSPLADTVVVPEVTKAAALAAFKAESAKEVVLEEGKTVQVGQALLFINLTHYHVPQETLVLSELASTTILENGKEGETIWSRVKALAQNFVDGVLTLTGLKADRVEVKNELCVDDVCVTADDLRALLNNARSNSGASGGSPAPTPEPTPTPDPDTSTGEGSGTGSTGGEGVMSDGGGGSAGGEATITTDTNTSTGAGEEETPPPAPEQTQDPEPEPEPEPEPAPAPEPAPSGDPAV